MGRLLGVHGHHDQLRQHDHRRYGLDRPACRFDDALQRLEPGPRRARVGCIRVTYGGSLASSVKLYTSAVANGTAFNLQVERGSGLSSPDNTMNCTGFSSSSTAYNGALGSFADDVRGRRRRQGRRRSVGDERRVDYRFTITVVDDPTPNAHTSALSSNAHTFTWEARNN